MVVEHYFDHCLLHLIGLSELGVKANAKTRLQYITLSKRVPHHVITLLSIGEFSKQTMTVSPSLEAN